MRLRPCHGHTTHTTSWVKRWGCDPAGPVPEESECLPETKGAGFPTHPPAYLGKEGMGRGQGKVLLCSIGRDTCQEKESEATAPNCLLLSPLKQ